MARVCIPISCFLRKAMPPHHCRRCWRRRRKGTIKQKLDALAQKVEQNDFSRLRSIDSVIKRLMSITQDDVLRDLNMETNYLAQRTAITYCPANSEISVEGDYLTCGVYARFPSVPKELAGNLMYEAAVSLKTARQRNTCEKENDAIDLLRDFVRCDNCGQPMKRRVSMKHRIRESWNCTNDDCGIRVRISDTQLIETITVLINRVILNDHLLQPKPRKRYEPDAKVTKVGNDIALELERDAPNEEYIIEKAIEMAALMYEQSNAKLNLTVSLARKLAHTMVTQDEFNRDYFTALASYITLGEQGRVVLHTKTETEVTLDDGSNESP